MIEFRKFIIKKKKTKHEKIYVDHTAASNTYVTPSSQRKINPIYLRGGSCLFLIQSGNLFLAILDASNSTHKNGSTCISRLIQQNYAMVIYLVKWQRRGRVQRFG